MLKGKAPKAHIKKERDPKKVKSVVKRKGFPGGKLPQGKELHHIKPVVEGGKTTLRNTKVVSEAKHKQIHKNHRKQGKI